MYLEREKNEENDKRAIEITFVQYGAFYKKKATLGAFFREIIQKKILVQRNNNFYFTQNFKSLNFESYIFGISYFPNQCFTKSLW